MSKENVYTSRVRRIYSLTNELKPKENTIVKSSKSKVGKPPCINGNFPRKPCWKCPSISKILSPYFGQHSWLMSPQQC